MCIYLGFLTFSLVIFYGQFGGIRYYSVMQRIDVTSHPGHHTQNLVQVISKHAVMHITARIDEG